MKFSVIKLAAILLSPMMYCQVSSSTVIAKISQVEEPEVRNEYNWSNGMGDMPVTVGLVLKKETLRSTDLSKLRLRDQSGFVDAYFESSGVWHDNQDYVKWLLVHFQARPDKSRTGINTIDYEVVLNRRFNPPSEDNIITEAQNGAVLRIDTDKLRTNLRSNVTSNLFNSLQLVGSDNLDAIGFNMPIINSGSSQSVRSWTSVQHQIEANSPIYARVMSTQALRHNGKEIMDVEVRQHFYHDKSFFKIDLSYTWRSANLNVNMKDFKLDFKLADQHIEPINVRAGVEGSGNISESETLFAFQKNPKGIETGPAANNLTDIDNHKLNGWLYLNGDNRNQFLLSAKNFWKEYPKGISYDSDKISYHIYGNERMDFKAKAFMSGPFEEDNGLNYFDYSVRNDQNGGCGGFHEFQFENGCVNCRNLTFKYNGQGISKTHELMFFFGLRPNLNKTRLHSLNERPVLYRQQPIEFSKRSKEVFGYRIPSLSRGSNYRYFERKIRDLGDLFIMKWESALDYGNFRHGTAKWGRPGSWSYRTYDGTQNGLQMIPWLLYLRGGERRYFEEAVNMSYHGMDISTNHHSTWTNQNSPRLRKGYQVLAGSYPNAFLPSHLNKWTKLDFLSIFYHITGNSRALETQKDIVKGMTHQFEHTPGILQKCSDDENDLDKPVFTLQIDAGNPPTYSKSDPSIGGREKNNQLSVWADALLENLKGIRNPEIPIIAKNQTLNDLSLGEVPGFKGPYLGYAFEGQQIKRENQLYLTEALLKQALVKDPARFHHIENRIEELLDFSGFRDFPKNSVANPYLAPLVNYEFQSSNRIGSTAKRNSARIAWDLALGIADIIPQVNFNPDLSNERILTKIPEEIILNNLRGQMTNPNKSYGYASMPNYSAMLKDYLMPMLSGLSLAKKYEWDEKRLMNEREDALVSGFGNDFKAVKTVYIRPERNTICLDIYSFFKKTSRLIETDTDCEDYFYRWEISNLTNPDEVIANNTRKINRDSHTRSNLSKPFNPKKWNLTLTAGDTYKLILVHNPNCRIRVEGNNFNTADNLLPYYRIECEDADIVYKIPEECFTGDNGVTVNASRFINISGHKKSNTAVRLFFRPLEDEIFLEERSVNNSQVLTLRFANSRDLIAQTPLFQENASGGGDSGANNNTFLVVKHDDMANKLIMLTTGGSSSNIRFWGRGMVNDPSQKIKPYFSTKKKYYFDPLDQDNCSSTD